MMFETDGKIYVVVAVIAIIVAGLAAFLFYLEHRLRKAERQLDKLEGRSAERHIAGEKA